MINGCPPEDTMLYWTTVKVTPTTMCFLAYILNVINLYIGESHTKKETLVHKYVMSKGNISHGDTCLGDQEKTGHFPTKRSTVNIFF